MKAKLGLVVVMAVVGCALAGAQEPSGAFEGQIPVNCTLKKALSSRDVKVGQEIAAAVRHENRQACSVEVIPFGSTLVLDTKNHLQPMALLRIRVTHTGDMHEPAGAAEQEAIRGVEAQLKALGVTAGRSQG